MRALYSLCGMSTLRSAQHLLLPEHKHKKGKDNELTQQEFGENSGPA